MVTPTPLHRTQLDGLPLFKRGKVRDIYDLGDTLLIVSTDRISCFDVVLPTCIPHKGEVLTRLSQFWFDYTSPLVQNHCITTDWAEFPPSLQAYQDQLRGRTMVVRKLTPLPLECVVRGYLAGSGWRE